VSETSFRFFLNATFLFIAAGGRPVNAGLWKSALKSTLWESCGIDRRELQVARRRPVLGVVQDKVAIKMAHTRLAWDLVNRFVE
jgi:hypothetical protein